MHTSLLDVRLLLGYLLQALKSSTEGELVVPDREKVSPSLRSVDDGVVQAYGIDEGKLPKRAKISILARLGCLAGDVFPPLVSSAVLLLPAPRPKTEKR